MRLEAERDPRLARFAGSLVASLPASAVVVACADEHQLRFGAAGLLGPDRSSTPDLEGRFDLASLTKPIVATLALVLDRRGTLPLDTRIGDLVPAAHPRLARRHLSTLLRHRSGLAAWTPLMIRCNHSAEVLRFLAAGGSGGELLGAPEPTYSDLGFILWGKLAEAAAGDTLGRLVRRHVAQPLVLGFMPPPGPRPEVAACSLDNAVEVRLAAEQGYALTADGSCRHGAPQDGNARFLGGLGGHAGLFGTVSDLVALAHAWWSEWPEVLDPSAIDKALSGQGAYAMGWARRRIRGSAGRSLPPGAFGHTGFTGTSLWIDPSARRAFVLLAHRLRSDSDMNAWRRRFHALTG